MVTPSRVRHVTFLLLFIGSIKGQFGGFLGSVENRQQAREKGEKTLIIFLHSLAVRASKACEWFLGPGPLTLTEHERGEMSFVSNEKHSDLPSNYDPGSWALRHVLVQLLADAGSVGAFTCGWGEQGGSGGGLGDH